MTWHSVLIRHGATAFHLREIILSKVYFNPVIKFTIKNPIFLRFTRKISLASDILDRCLITKSCVNTFSTFRGHHQFKTEFEPSLPVQLLTGFQLLGTVNITVNPPLAA